MTKFSIPTRKFCDGDKTMFAMRIPAKLLDAIKKHADEKQWTTTELITTILDQYLQSQKK
jgi:predicted DNA binding CopG/RHH family protein